MAIDQINGCIGCGTCVPTCPTDVLRMDPKSRKATIAYPLDCQVCYLCQQYCPVDAITITDERVIPSITSWG